MVPCLAKEFVNPHMVPFVLPAVLMIAEEASGPDFVQHVLPELKPVMKMTDPIQVTISSDYTLKLLGSVDHFHGCVNLGSRNLHSLLKY